MSNLNSIYETTVKRCFGFCSAFVGQWDPGLCHSMSNSARIWRKCPCNCGWLPADLQGGPQLDCMWCVYMKQRSHACTYTHATPPPSQEWNNEANLLCAEKGGHHLTAGKRCPSLNIGHECFGIVVHPLIKLFPAKLGLCWKEIELKHFPLPVFFSLPPPSPITFSTERQASDQRREDCERRPVLPCRYLHGGWPH